MSMTDYNLPTLEECEQALEDSFGPSGSAAAWVGRCYEIAAKLLAQNDIEGSVLEGRFPKGTRLCYGHYLGERTPAGLYPNHYGVPFAQHGWLELPDGRIFDPTGWAFYSSEPAIYVGPADDYDEGGNSWRKRNLSPPLGWDPAAKSVELGLTTNIGTWLQAEYGTPEPDGVLSVDQAFHLANRHPDELPDVEAIYRALVNANLAGLIPLDNRRKYLKGAA
jgi:hypothetical protein